jgi:hypothetical protein
LTLLTLPEIYLLFEMARAPDGIVQPETEELVAAPGDDSGSSAVGELSFSLCLCLCLVDR